MRFIVVTGGVISGLGKGIVASSIGLLLKSAGFSVVPVKIDPYVNVDAGTMRPTEHGEVWVTVDGGELDEDFGHYERFLDIELSKSNNLTTGKLYSRIIERERKGEFLGKTVQVIPHVTGEIQDYVIGIGKSYGADFVIVEVGGVVGDYENEIFLRALRDLSLSNETAFVHVAYAPIPGHLGEMKTKPVQQSITFLNKHGIMPDFIAVRAEKPMDRQRKMKIASAAAIPEERIISIPDVGNVYSIPLMLHEQGFGRELMKKFGFTDSRPDLSKWEEFVERMNKGMPVKIAIIGKYLGSGNFSLEDSYISVKEAVLHAGAQIGVKPEILWLDSTSSNIDLSGIDGIIIPGGFGSSGVEGKIAAIKYARENKIPFLGLCYGFQLAVVEFARNVIGWGDAQTAEISRTSHPVIDLLPSQKEALKKGYGATMRLGAHRVLVRPGTLAYRLYRTSEVSERFRHRYEVNPDYIDDLESNGLVFSGISAEEERIMQIGELEGQFFIGTQFHPEFGSRPLRPHPLFLGLVEAAKAFRSEQ